MNEKYLNDIKDGKTIDTSEIKYLIVQNDSSIDTIKFQLKKMYEEKDLSQYAFVLMYANSEGAGEAVSLTKTVEDDLLYLSFTPGRPFTDISGKMTIIIQGVKSASEKWQSMPANINIENNVSPDPIRPLDPSLIQQLIDKIQDIEEDFEEVQGMFEEEFAYDGSYLTYAFAAMAIQIIIILFTFLFIKY